MAFFKAQDGITSVSLGANEYPVKNGVFEVSDEHEGLFLAFGYEYGPAPAIEEKPKRKVKQVESEGEA